MKKNAYYRLIYAFEFPDNSVYVGLTYNSTERKNEHLNSNRKIKSSVNEYIQKTGLKPKFIILTEYMAVDNAAKMEGVFLEKYENNGWKILNKVKTGGLGGNRKFWNRNKCIEAAKKCTYKSEFIKKFNGAYESALKNGWIDICCSHMKRPSAWNKKYDINLCLLYAKKCNSKSEFQKKYSNAYQVARNNNWLELCTKHMINPKIKWTFEECMKVALKYGSRSEFKKKCCWCI